MKFTTRRRDITRVGAKANREALSPIVLASFVGLSTSLLINSCSSEAATPYRPFTGKGIEFDAIASAARDNNLEMLELYASQGVNLGGSDESGKTALMCAAEKGALEAAEFLARRTATLSQRDKGGASAFAYAVSNEQLPVASMLLCSGAPADEMGHLQQPLLLNTVMKGNHPAMLMLLENRAGYGMNPALREALKSGKTVLAKDLLRFGANPDVRIDGASALSRAIEKGDDEQITLLLRYGADPNKRDESGDTALLLAIQREDDALAQRLLEVGGDPNLAGANGRPPLLRLIDSERRELIDKLIAKGADVSFRDENEMTLLGHALSKQKWSLAEMLISKGVNPDEPCRGPESPIAMAFADKNVPLAEFLLKRDAAPHPVLFHQAVDAGSRDLLDLYLDHGADVDAKDGEGDTVLAKAVRKGDLEMTRYLLQRGSNVLMTGKEGQEPLVLAVATKNPEMTKLLIESGADPDRKLLEPYSKSFKELAKSSKLSWYMERDSHFYPIMVAAASGHGDTIRALLESGARQYPYTRQYQRYPISFASESGHIEAQQLLVGYDPRKAKEDLKVVINLTSQRAVLYKNGEVALSSSVSTGKPGYRTPTGDYVITHKHRHWNSSLYGSSMPYFMRLSCAAFGMHVGYVPGYPASHGCIRMPESGAKAFWGSAPVGTPVSIIK